MRTASMQSKPELSQAETRVKTTPYPSQLGLFLKPELNKVCKNPLTKTELTQSKPGPYQDLNQGLKPGPWPHARPQRVWICAGEQGLWRRQSSREVFCCASRCQETWRI